MQTILNKNTNSQQHSVISSQSVNPFNLVQNAERNMGQYQQRQQQIGQNQHQALKTTANKGIEENS